MPGEHCVLPRLPELEALHLLRPEPRFRLLHALHHNLGPASCSLRQQQQFQAKLRPALFVWQLLQLSAVEEAPRVLLPGKPVVTPLL